MKALGYKSFSLDNLKYTDLKRPYAEGFIDFNISHSGAYTICAIAENGKVGVDIEEIKSIPVSDFIDQFSEKELNTISTSDNILHSFYTLWTQKEAFLKAIGTGLFIPLNKVFIEENKIIWNNSNWFLHNLKIDKDYPCHFCTPIAMPGVVVKPIEFV
jgi:4'-phosphopantetheinyl transferase